MQKKTIENNFEKLMQTFAKERIIIINSQGKQWL